MVKWREAEPRDDYMHPVEAATNYNESAYYNVFDAGAQIGGRFRMGNRLNEGRAEMTTCIYLPGGTVAFMFARPDITGNERFEAAGLRFDIVEPGKIHEVSYDGTV